MNYLLNVSYGQHPNEINDITFFNLTGLIYTDMVSYLLAHIDSFPNPVSAQREQNWKSIAKDVFYHLEEEEDLVKSLNHDLIMKCAFKHPIWSKITYNDPCHMFNPILTSAGVCHSFNGMETPSKLWKKSMIADSMFKIEENMTGFTDFNFRGTGAAEGIDY